LLDFKSDVSGLVSLIGIDMGYLRTFWLKGLAEKSLLGCVIYSTALMADIYLFSKLTSGGSYLGFIGVDGALFKTAVLVSSII
jgi:hypothetical protein